MQYGEVGRRNCRMLSLQIRDVPPDVYEAVAARAKAENRSMAQQAVELRRLPELVAHETRKQVLARLRERRQKHGERELSIPAAKLIREDRDR
jgi:antitoxin FitA